MPRFSIIIPTRFRAEELGGCLDSLSEAGAAGDDFEVIVVDNGPDEATARRVEEAGRGGLAVQRIVEAGRGPSRARNAGAGAAGGEMLIFLDDDARAERGWAAAFARAAEASGSAPLQGRVATEFLGGRPVWMTDALAAFLGRLDEGEEGGALRGTMNSANMAVGRELFLRLGGFRTDLGPGGAGMGEDTEFGIRAAARGFPPRYVPEAAVRHRIAPERTTRRAMLRRLYRSGLAQALIERYEEPAVRLLGHLARRTAEGLGRAAFARDGAEQMTALCDLAQRFGRARGILRRRWAAGGEGR